MHPLVARARAAGVRLVRIGYCDSAGLTRAKAVPIGGLEGALRFGLGFTVAQQALPMMADTVLPDSGLTPAGEAFLVPDPGTFTPLPYSPGAAALLGEFQTADGGPWAHCPRACLARAVAAAGAAGVAVVAAFEPEFYLLRAADGDYQPVDRTNFAETAAHDQSHDVLRDLIDTLEAMGLGVNLLYPESGPGQFEVSIRHAPAVDAADRHVLLRDAVRGVVRRHGLVATFAPVPVPDAAGSGCHVHMSLEGGWGLRRGPGRRGGRNLLYDPRDPLRLSPAGYAWIAGILAHLPGLCALTTPSVNSYQRLRPGRWAGAFACYGPENREAAIRVITPRRGPASLNVELKTADGTANPYLALAGIIAAGLDGLRRRLHPGRPVTTDPATLSEEERRALGITALPANPEEALAALARDQVLLATLGEPLARSYTAVRRAEWRALGGLTPGELARRYAAKY